MAPSTPIMTMDWSDYDFDKLYSPGTASLTTVDTREKHKLAERERRKSMRDLFLSLHALLPNCQTVRKEQSQILDEIIKFIPIAVSRLKFLRAKNLPRGHSHTQSGLDLDHGFVINLDDSTNDFEIRVAPIVVRVRGDRMTVSLTHTKASPHSGWFMLSSVLELLASSNLQLVRVTQSRDGPKVLHHSESKICNGKLERSPEELKASLQDLSQKLRGLTKSPNNTVHRNNKRSFDQINM